MIIFSLFLSIVNLSFCGNLFSQEVEPFDSLSPNWREENSEESMLIYNYSNLTIDSYLNTEQLQFSNDFHYIGFEHCISKKWCKGFSFSMKYLGLIANSQVLNYNKYKVGSFRTSIQLGYKLRLFDRLIFEPGGILEWGNFRIKDKTADSKLTNNALNIGLDFNIKVIPYLSLSNRLAITVGLYGGYIYKVPNKEWIASKNFDSQLTAQPFNWSTFNFGIKIGFIEL